jgi:Proteobacterial lipase chaperone protein.
MTNKKRFFIVLITAAISAFVALVAFRMVNYLYYKNDENYLKKHYILDKGFPDNPKKPSASSNTLLSDGTVTGKTLEFFRFLQQRFAVKSINELDEHYNKVREYFDARFNKTDASRLFEMYKKYMECVIELGNNPKYRAKTSDPKVLLMLLYKGQGFRRDRLGRENADALFGSDVKEREYLLRRAMIIGDKTLYGKEKENRLQELKGDMWDNAEISIGEDSNPYNRYQLKMQLYQKDLAEWGEREHKFKIEEFRKEFFSKEQIKKLREVDDQIAKEKANIERYRAAEKDILNLKNMTREEKDKKIKALQDEFFGSEADAFRRREAMRRDAEK